MPLQLRGEAERSLTGRGTKQEGLMLNDFGAKRRARSDLPGCGNEQEFAGA
jgi:hypothetical protein